MIISIGTDIVEVYRMRETLQRTPRFVQRVFTDEERLYCESRGLAKFESYAARFAAKEAFLKAIRTGWRDGIKWKEIQVCREETGFPYLKVTGTAEKALQHLKVDRLHLSLSHTQEHAIAIVILERI